MCPMGKAITHKHILKQFGHNLKITRQEKRISQEDLAGKLNMHRTYIGMIERGERNPTIRTLYKISKALGIKSSQILPF